jgi:hypothetical protein
MKSTAAVAITALSALACTRDPVRAPVRVPVHATVVQPTAAQLDAAAARLPRCVLPVVDAARWRQHRLRAGQLALRLPPGYRADSGTAPPGQSSHAWSAPDSGYVTVMSDAMLGGTFVLQPAGRPLEAPVTCALPLLGHVARVTLLSFGDGASLDTVHVVALDVPQSDQLQVGAGAMHHRRGARDSLLAALATLMAEP